MALLFSRWERRDGADREAFGLAALNFCRASRDEQRQTRFYWASPDTVVLISTAPTTADLFPHIQSEQAKAGFALADLAQRTEFETWAEPGAGEETYRIAGR